MGPSDPLKIDKLKRIMAKSMKKWYKNKYTVKCMNGAGIDDFIVKSANVADGIKAEVDELFAQKDLSFTQLYKILILFNKSIAWAPKDSKQLAVTYANKSAILLRMRKYKECIAEIDRALNIADLTSLRIKMLCRKAECLTALALTGNRTCLKKARFNWSKLKDLDGNKLMLNKLIKKTQRIIDEDKLDIPKEERRKTYALKMMAEAEKRNLTESVKVEYSEKYGRHLVAARNFGPGDIILIEKPYFNSLADPRMQHYCDHCFYHLWTAVPCDSCARRLYCSEKCRTEAWNEYHEMECLALTNMMKLFNIRMHAFIPILVSAFCKALRQAGSIEQLLADSETSNETADFTSYKSIFTLPIGNALKSILEECIEISTGALIGLAIYTQILGKSYTFKEIKNLMEDDSAVLVGALLLKFAIILKSGSPRVNLYNPNEQNDQNEDDTDELKKVNRNGNSFTLPIRTLHTLVGCIPNVDLFYTHGNKYIICAIQPIKAGEQLITYSKTKSSIWNKSPESERQLQHEEMYNCPCECQACTENWSDIFLDATKYSDPVDDGTLCPIAMNLWNESLSIISDWEVVCHKPSFPDPKILSRSVELVRAAWEQLPMPSPVIHRSVLLLRKVLETFYDPSEIYGKVPFIRTLKMQTISDANL